MTRAPWCSLVLLSATVALASAQVPSDADVRVRHTVIAASGDAAPTGGTYLSFSFINARLNTRHEVVFDAVVSGPPLTTGVFVGDGRTPSPIALGTSLDPAVPTFGEVFNPFITANGDVVFQANFSDILVADGRTIVALARSGDQVPGGGTLVAGTSYSVSDNGTVAYLASLSDTTASRGIFRTDGNDTVVIVRDDVEPPTGGRFVALRPPLIEGRTQVVFSAEMTGGAADFGVFRGDGQDLTPVFSAGQMAPGGATFADFGNPLINRHGLVATFASLANGASREGLFVSDGTDVAAVALDGAPAPKGGSYGRRPGFPNAFLSPIRLNDRGELAFPASLTGGTTASGIFRGNGERTNTIALAGTPAPGTTGTFEAFGDLKLGNDGRVAFIAMLAIGGDVNDSNNVGIWIGTSDEDLQLVVRTGDVIKGRVLTRLPIFAFDSSSQFDVNQNDIMWVGNFGPTKAVVLSRVPGVRGQE
jgi:hypothetical protein